MQLENSSFDEFAPLTAEVYTSKYIILKKKVISARKLTCTFHIATKQSSFAHEKCLSSAAAAQTVTQRLLRTKTSRSPAAAQIMH